jgi:hypothetical protein
MVSRGGKPCHVPPGPARYTCIQDKWTESQNIYQNAELLLYVADPRPRGSQTQPMFPTVSQKSRPNVIPMDASIEPRPSLSVDSGPDPDPEGTGIHEPGELGDFTENLDPVSSGPGPAATGNPPPPFVNHWQNRTSTHQNRWRQRFTHAQILASLLQEREWLRFPRLSFYSAPKFLPHCSSSSMTQRTTPTLSSCCYSTFSH